MIVTVKYNNVHSPRYAVLINPQTLRYIRTERLNNPAPSSWNERWDEHHDTIIKAPVK